MTPHIEAKKGDYSDIVLLPGDPLRAKWIADTYLDEVKQVNSVRNMLGFTGYLHWNDREGLCPFKEVVWEWLPTQSIYMNSIISMMCKPLLE